MLPNSLIRAIANGGMGQQGMLPFWFGESDQPTPGFIREAAIQSLKDGETFYTPNLGRPYLREALATYMTRVNWRAIAADRVAVTTAGINALMAVGQTLLSPGDRVVAVTPIWPNMSRFRAFSAAR